MIRKEIRYSDSRVYAICYVRQRVIYYNLNFHGGSQIYVIR